MWVLCVALAHRFAALLLHRHKAASIVKVAGIAAPHRGIALWVLVTAEHFSIVYSRPVLGTGAFLDPLTAPLAAVILAAGNCFVCQFNAHTNLRNA